MPAGAYNRSGHKSAITMPRHVIEHDRSGDAAEEGERSHLALDLVRQLLAGAGKGEGKIGRAQHRDKICTG